MLYINSYVLERKELVITKIKLFLFSASINTHVTNEEFLKEYLKIEQNIKRLLFKVNEQPAATVYSTVEKLEYIHQ